MRIQPGSAWHTIAGGSHRYVQAVVEPWRDRLRLRTPIVEIRRAPDHVTVLARGGEAMRFDDVVLDNVFEPSTGAATIAWPDAEIAVTVDADSSLDRRVVYVPEGRDSLAFEPATHMTDAFNRAARGQPGTGTRRLPPGASFSCTMRLHALRPPR